MVTDFQFRVTGLGVRMQVEALGIKAKKSKYDRM